MPITIYDQCTFNVAKFNDTHQQVVQATATLAVV